MFLLRNASSGSRSAKEMKPKTSHPSMGEAAAVFTLPARLGLDLRHTVPFCLAEGLTPVYIAVLLWTLMPGEAAISCIRFA